MRVSFRVTRTLLDKVHADLSRPHQFALERVGFFACKTAASGDGFLLLALEYLPLADEDYEDDARYGAMMGPGAIRKALQHAYRHNVSMMHVHRHEHAGVPRFSPDDIAENAKFVPDFFKVRPRLPHGAVVLSHNALFGEVWEPGTNDRRNLNQASVIGRQLFSFWS